MGMNTIIPRRHHDSFKRFLTHKDPRIIEAARQMQDLDAQTRAEWKALRREEQELEDRMLEAGSWVEAVEPDLDDPTHGEDFDDNEIPF